MYKAIKAVVCIVMTNLLIVVGCSAVFAAPELVLKFAGQSNADHPATKLMNDVANEIAEKTNGRISGGFFILRISDSPHQLLCEQGNKQCRNFQPC
jgi:hypothetical protein